MAPVATNISNGRSGSKTVRLTERERVATLSGSAAFKVQLTFRINPALPTFLPWLSTMAQLYEKYRVKSIRVMYHNLCGTNTAGNVLMAFDPDVLDGAPADAVAFSQSTRYIDGAPWRMLTLNIPGSNQSYFTRSGAQPTGSDLKTYDYGQVHIATEAMADATSVGYIEIAYDIEFLERQPAPTSGGTYSFRPQVYAGVPDPGVPVVVAHTDHFATREVAGDNTATQRLHFNGVLPLLAIVDDIGVSGFNGSLVLPSGSYALSTSLPSGGYCKDPGDLSSGPATPGSRPPPQASRLLAAFGVSLVGDAKVDFPPLSGSGLSTSPYMQFRWVDSAGKLVDACGIADLTGVALWCEFTLDIQGESSVNGRPITESGSFTTTISPAKPGEGLWPTAVITKISELA